jgi:hypothetical protein
MGLELTSKTMRSVMVNFLVFDAEMMNTMTPVVAASSIVFDGFAMAFIIASIRALLPRPSGLPVRC